MADTAGALRHVVGIGHGDGTEGAARACPLAPPAEIPSPLRTAPKKAKNAGFKFPVFGGTCGRLPDQHAGATFAFGLLAGAGIAAWMIPPV
jgi:hypothetical protein